VPNNPLSEAAHLSAAFVKKRGNFSKFLKKLALKGYFDYIHFQLGEVPPSHL